MTKGVASSEWGVGRVVVDDLRELERVLTVSAGEKVRYLMPILEGLPEPRKRQIILDGEGASVDVFGLFLGHADAALQLTLDTIHAAPHTRSTTLFKGALAGQSVFDINGVIRMTKAAHGADAYLEERALLLSPDALATAIPSLEIEANDVKCRHAAAAGPVDPEALFYLRSRGFSVDEAEAMLVRGFLQAVLRQLPRPWQKRVERLMEKELIAARFSLLRDNARRSRHSQPFAATLNPVAIRKDFPIFQAHPDLVYLDSTATSQKPQVVIEAMDAFQSETNANPHRGIYQLAEAATSAYEQARVTVARFLGAEPQQLVWTRNATEAINLVARAWGAVNLGPKDTVVLTVMEHHSNIVPWQLLQKEKGFRIEYLPITKEGRLDLEAARRTIKPGVKLVSVTHMSNVLSAVNPVRELIELAHSVGATVVVDGAQAAAHLPVNFTELGADFYAFSGHKMLGPFGIGGLIAKRELLEAMPPFLGGGEMIREVTLQGATWNDVPYKFEAGTPNAVGAIGLGAAIEYLAKLGMHKVWQHEHELATYALEKFDALTGVRTYGPRGDDRGGVVTFTIDGVHPHDIASLLDEQGIAVRAGHHCAMPLHRALGIPSSARASFGVYTTKQDIDVLVDGLKSILKVFA